MISYRLLALAAILALLAGCSAMPERGNKAGEVLELLDYHGRLLALPESEQQRALEDAQAGFEQRPDNPRRLRLALLLSMPQAPWQDDGRAVQLLQPLVEIPQDSVSPHREFALLLQRIIGERQRLVREEQFKAEKTQKRLQNLLAERQRQLREEQRKSEVLQEKIDALRAIDQDTQLKRRRR